MTEKADKAEQILNSFLTQTPESEPQDNNKGVDVSAIQEQNQQLQQMVTTLQDSLGSVQQQFQNSESVWQTRLEEQSKAINDLSQFQQAQRTQSQLSQFELNETELEAVTPEVQSAFNKMLQRTLVENGLIGESNPLNQVNQLSDKLHQIEQTVGNVDKRFQDADKAQMNAMIRRTGIENLARDPRFQSYLDEPIGLSGLTRRDDLKTALSTNNEPALLQLRDAFQGVQTSPQTTIEGSASPVAQQANEFKYSRAEYDQAFADNFAALNRPMPESDRQKITEKFAQMQEALREGKVNMQQ